MSDIPFTHLHVHSQYSLLDGKASVKGLVNKAIDLGMRGIALTDHGNMFGIKEFFNYVEEVNSKRGDDEKFKPILGCEMYCAADRLTDRKDKNDKGYHLIVLAKNEKGYHNLIKLVSKAWTEGFYYHARTDRYELAEHHEGLIVCSACLGGEVPRHIAEGRLELAEERVRWFKEIFGDDYYIELQRHKTDKPNANVDVYPQQCKVNEVLLQFARKYDIKVVATNDVHFVEEADGEAHDRLICISTQKRFNEPRMHYTKQEWLKSTEQMREIFADIPEAIDNTQEILDKVETYSIDHAPIMPTFDIPESFGTEAQYRETLTERDLFDEFTRDENGNVVMSEADGEKKIAKLGGYDKLYRIKLEADYLRKLTMEGAVKRYGDPLPDDVKERLNFELYIMKTMGFPGYFLIVQDFINTARNKLGVSVGPGRGSAAGSAAAYCLGITDIDPIKYDLLFERFLNPDRISLPDIDVDFDDDGRYEVLKYVTEKYGAEKVAHIITYQTMATKSAIKDMAKIMEVPLAESNRLARLIPDKLPEVDGKSVKVNFKNCMKYVKELAAEAESPNPNIREVIKYAPQLEGNVRTTGVHACGVIICRDDITDWVPVMMGEDADGSKVISTQYEGSVIEQTGLIKMDFLGLKTLSIIKEVLANIRKSRGIEIDIDHIPLDDPATFKLYCDGNTTATFQFESVGMQRSLRELQPSKFEDLIAMNALYRPGPMDYIPSFIARKNGQEEIKYDIPCMEKYLKDTYGITVYQEQVMLLSRQLASFTRGESDALRKAMGKKKKAIVDAMKPKFIKQGQENGHDPKVLEKIWGDWEKFASYAFNKSHATCYSWVAYQTAYLKAHYPAEYMAALMTRRFAQITEITKLMEECQSMGIKTLGPDVNESYRAFGVNEHGEIRFGLSAIKGMGAPAADAIVEERQKNGPYKNIFDFAERVDFSNVNRKAFETLALSGGFDSFGIKRENFFGKNSRGEIFLDTLVKYGQLYQREQQEAATSLFGGADAVEIATPPIPDAEPWSTIERLNKERELVGIYLSAHPLDEYELILNNMCNTHCTELGDKVELSKKEDIVFGGIITEVKSKFTKTGKPCGFVTIEDFEGSGELALFGEDWGQWRGAMVEGSTIYVTAKCAPRYANSTYLDFKISTVEYLQTVKENRIERFTITVDSTIIDDTLVNDIQTLVSKDEGRAQLYLQIHDAESNTNILMRAQDQSVGVSHDLIQFIKANPKMSYQIN